MGNGISKKNQSGCADPTAYEALTSVQNELNAEVDQRASALIKELKSLIRQNEFDLLARIEVKDRRTGRCYR